MVVQHNIMAINSHRNLGINNSNLSKNLEKLSSGYRINRAADDAAGLAISEKMRAQITGIDRAVLNAQDGASLIQTAEGALTEVHSMLNRMVELATQSANGTYQADDRQKIESELNALKDEIDRISEATNFNGIKLLDGSLSESGTAEIKLDNLNITYTGAVAGVTKITFTSLDNTATGDTNVIQIGMSNDKINLTFEKTDVANQYKVGNNKYIITDSATLASAVKAELEGNKSFDDNFSISAAGEVLTITAKEGGTKVPQVTGFSHVDSAGITVGDSSITDATPAADAFRSAPIKEFTGANEDEAVFSVNGVKFAIVGGATAAARAENAQKLRDKGVNVALTITGTATADDYTELAGLINQKTGLNVTANGATLEFKELPGSGKGLTMQVGDTADAWNKITVSVDDMSTVGIGIAGISMATQEASAAALDSIKAAIEKVSVNRGNLGALQNRLEHTINNLNVTSENMTAAESRIRDVDMAKEMMDFTKNNVLAQAAQAMLAQANMQPQQVLQLLR